MSLLLPKQAIPTYIYSTKTLFFTELNINGLALADTYVLYVRKLTPPTSSSVVSSSIVSSSAVPIEDQWDFIVVLDADTNGNVAKTVVLDDMEPATEYETMWELRTNNNLGSYTSTWSEVYSFLTRYRERFPLRPPIPVPLDGADFTYALQNELDEHINYINTIEEERSIERLVKEGVGKLEATYESSTPLPVGLQYCDLIVADGKIALVNGLVQASSGLLETNRNYFFGARIFNIYHPRGYVYLEGDNYPNITVDDFNAVGGAGQAIKLYAYLAAYKGDDDLIKLDIFWSQTILTPRPDGRMLLGSIDFVTGTVNGEAGLVPVAGSSDNAIADVIWSTKTLRQKILELLDTIENITGGTWPKNAKELIFDPDASATESTFDAVLRIKAELRQLFEEQSGGGAILAEQESLIENIANNFARAMASLGKLMPESLLKIDGAWVLKGKYGDGVSPIQLEDGTTIISPNFEGPGNLSYNPISKKWEI